MAAIVLIVGWAGVARAQLPVCPQPDPDKPVYTACLSGGRFLVVPLLTSLAIDLLLKADGSPIKREAHALFESTASPETLEKNAALADYLGELEPIVLTRIDTATGTLRMDAGEGERNFSGTITMGGAEHHVAIELPARLEGGYWRTPGALQVAFWKGQRATFSARSASGASIEAEIECLAVSADGIRLVPAGASIPEILVRFDGCE